MTRFIWKYYVTHKFSSVTKDILQTLRNPRTVHMQTVCTRLPLSLLTQEPGIKANDLYIIVYAGTSTKPLSPGCGDANVINLFKQIFIIYLPLQHRPVALGWRVSITMCTCNRVSHYFCAEFYVNL